MNLIERLFNKNHKSSSKGRMSPMDRQKLIENWDKIEELEKLSKPSTLREAVVEADKMVDSALDKIYPGRTSSAERLKEAKELFQKRQDYENLWYAHKIRNELVHTVGFELPSVEAKNILVYFKTALEVIGVL